MLNLTKAKRELLEATIESFACEMAHKFLYATVEQMCHHDFYSALGHEVSEDEYKKACRAVKRRAIAILLEREELFAKLRQKR